MVAAAEVTAAEEEVLVEEVVVEALGKERKERRAVEGVGLHA